MDTEQHAAADAQTTHDGIPAAVDTPQVEKVVAEVKSDVAAIWAQAKAGAKQTIDDAVSAAGKLLQIAAGDAQAVLTDSENAVLSIVASKVPIPGAAGILFDLASKSEAVINQAVDAKVQFGLAVALADLKQLQNAIEQHL